MDPIELQLSVLNETLAQIKVILEDLAQSQKREVYLEEIYKMKNIGMFEKNKGAKDT